MLKQTLFTSYVLVQAAICGCQQQHKSRSEFETADNKYTITKVGKMGKLEVAESSGFAWSEDGNLWTHNDGGNANELYKVNLAGELITTLTIPDTKNADWEDLTKDKSGNIYIGDFGNNNNKRQDLRIFRVNEKDFNKVDTILFKYADQLDFPPAKPDRNFDCEAFFWFGGNLYLFTKDRGRQELVKVYRIPDKPGNYVAKAIDSLQIDAMITAADVSPDGKRFALLGYGKVYIFENAPGDKMFDGPKFFIPVEESGQAEALVFKNENDLIFSNEKGKIFSVTKK